MKHADKNIAKEQDPQYLAKEAIHLLELKIKKDFGYNLEIGAELEFVIEPTAEYKISDDPLGTTSERGKSFLPSKYLQQTDKDRLFPDSPYVTYSYTENDSPTAHLQYEAVISHIRTKNGQPLSIRSVNEHYSPAIHTARIIEATYAEIAGIYSHKERREATYQKVSKLRKNADILKKQCVSKLLMEPCVKDARGTTTNSLHINVSINSKDKSKQLEDIQYKYNEEKYIKNYIEKISFSALNLLGTDASTLERSKFRNYHSGVIYRKKINKQNYFENRIPSSTSNPYYAILLTLGGIYAGLKAARNGEENRELKEDFVGSFHSSQKDFFKNDNPLRKILNEMQPELGNKFVAAVEKIPPGTERGKVNDRLR